MNFAKSLRAHPADAALRNNFHISAIYLLLSEQFSVEINSCRVVML